MLLLPLKVSAPDVASPVVKRCSHSSYLLPKEPSWLSFSLYPQTPRMAPYGTICSRVVTSTQWILCSVRPPRVQCSHDIQALPWIRVNSDLPVITGKGSHTMLSQYNLGNAAFVAPGFILVSQNYCHRLRWKSWKPQVRRPSFLPTYGCNLQQPANKYLLI